MPGSPTGEAGPRVLRSASAAFPGAVAESCIGSGVRGTPAGAPVWDAGVGRLQRSPLLRTASPCLLPPDSPLAALRSRGLALYPALSSFLSMEILPLMKQLCTQPQAATAGSAGSSGLRCLGAKPGGLCWHLASQLPFPSFFSPCSLGRETRLQDSQGSPQRRVQSGQQPPAAGGGRPPQPVFPPAGLQRTERSEPRYSSPGPSVVWARGYGLCG